MKSVEDVWDLLRCGIVPREAGSVELAEADGRVLRQEVRATEDLPAFDRSAVDGHVVHKDDQSTEFAVSGEIRAGDTPPRRLKAGDALRIATGAAVPENGEVVMLEDSTEAAGMVRFARRGRSHVRRRGEDARAGDRLLAAGTVLGAGAIGLLASVGCSRPMVTRGLEALHVATGNEIVDAGQNPSIGQVRDSNSPLVAAWARQRALRLEQKRVGESAEALRDAIEGRRDLLLVSGGASVGGHDCTEEVLRAVGFAILVTKVAVRPGKPLIVGRRGDEWVFGLPGNPLSHFVCLNVFVDVALAAMRGSPSAPMVWHARLLSGIEGNPRETWWPVAEESDGLRPLGWTSSGDLTALGAANGLARVPSSGLAAGDLAGFIRVR